MTTSTSTPDVSRGPTLTPLRRPAVTSSRRPQHPQPPRGPRFGRVPVYRARLIPDTDSEDGEQKQERVAAVEKLGTVSVNNNPAPPVTEDRWSDDKRHHSLHLVESPVRSASKVSLTSEVSEACSKFEAHLKKFDSDNDSDGDDEDPPWLQLHSSPNREEAVNNQSAAQNTLVDNALASEYEIGEKIVTSTSMNMDFLEVASLRQVCPGVLGASLVSLLNTEGGGALYLGAGPGGAVRGATLSRADRDHARQLLDRVLHDHIAPWAGLGKYVDIEFVPVRGGGELWVARVLVKAAPHLRPHIRFRLRGLASRGFRDGVYTRVEGRGAHTSD